MLVSFSVRSLCELASLLGLCATWLVVVVIVVLIMIIAGKVIVSKVLYILHEICESTENP